MVFMYDVASLINIFFSKSTVYCDIEAVGFSDFYALESISMFPTLNIKFFIFCRIIIGPLNSRIYEVLWHIFCFRDVDFEVIIVDNGSPDGTGDVVKHLQQVYGEDCIVKT